MNLNKKKKILILSPRFPFPPHKGDQLVIYNSIKYLSDRYQIDLLSFYDEKIDENYYKEVQKYCNEILLVKLDKLNIFYQIFKSFFTNIPMQVAYFTSSKYQNKLDYLLKKNEYDLLFPFTLRISQYVKDLRIKKYIHLIDSMYLNMKRRAENEKGIKKFIFNYESQKVGKYERQLINKYNKSFLVSQIDKDYIDSENKSIVVFPNGVSLSDCKKNYAVNEDLTLVFTGNMGYFPNQDAVIWFIETCWKEISRAFSNVNFKVIGKNPPQKIINLSSNYKNIDILGYVESMEEELCKADISIVPMQSGSGMQNKILEAMTTKTPVISSSLGLGDIKAKVGQDILIANDSKEMLNQIKYLSNLENRKFIGNNGFNYILEKHSWENIIFTRIDI